MAASRSRWPVTASSDRPRRQGRAGVVEVQDMGDARGVGPQLCDVEHGWLLSQGGWDPSALVPTQLSKPLSSPTTITSGRSGALPPGREDRCRMRSSIRYRQPSRPHTEVPKTAPRVARPRACSSAARIGSSPRGRSPRRSSRGRAAQRSDCSRLPADPQSDPRRAASTAAPVRSAAAAGCRRRPRDGLRLQRRLERRHADRRRQPPGARDQAARRLGALVVERADVLGRQRGSGPTTFPTIKCRPSRSIRRQVAVTKTIAGLGKGPGHSLVVLPDKKKAAVNVAGDNLIAFLDLERRQVDATLQTGAFP